MPSLPLLNGSCLCGAIQYQVNAVPFDADLCHCRQCQKSTGSVVGAWMDFKREQVNWLNQQPKEYASSEHVRRGFCQHCGTQISFRDLRYPDYLTLSISSLDDPSSISPNYHIYTNSQLKWLTIVDEYPKYKAGRS
ncbi:aldehyde-activating protein [Shewanella sairae]|uniref:Aldehyde-activating protein n=1 Tax=Shewanella sairae TaxID=190310 RepID=A0ABQ4PPS9_9GAMM|nr:GFA family protein [Shewanella sairae]MCL1130219.1 GFA family protein [Shewanella sairae]GIU50888.1 aldehyde-activating protein [Shewanella sairae]